MPDIWANTAHRTCRVAAAVSDAKKAEACFARPLVRQGFDRDDEKIRSANALCKTDRAYQPRRPERTPLALAQRIDAYPSLSPLRGDNYWDVGRGCNNPFQC